MRIEKGIPVPGRNLHRGHLTDTFRRMEIGDSVFIEGRRVLSGLYSTFRGLPGKKFTCRTQGDGVRVWRIE